MKVHSWSLALLHSTRSRGIRFKNPFVCITILSIDNVSEDFIKFQQLVYLLLEKEVFFQTSLFLSYIT
jgi:hypothetical protein